MKYVYFRNLKQNYFGYIVDGEPADLIDQIQIFNHNNPYRNSVIDLDELEFRVTDKVLCSPIGYSATLEIDPPDAQTSEDWNSLAIDKEGLETDFTNWGFAILRDKEKYHRIDWHKLRDPQQHKDAKGHRLYWSSVYRERGVTWDDIKVEK